MSSLKKYEYVIKIASCGGISLAAEELGIAQPALSKYLKKLEEEIGVELFDRSSIPIKPTAAGDAFIAAGIAMIDTERQLEKQIEEIKQRGEAVIRIGISPSRSPYMIPHIIKSYKNSCNGCRIIIEECTTAELSARLFCGELDLIISLLGEDTENFERVELFDESLLFAVPKDYADTAHLPLISVGQGQALWQTMESIVKKNSLQKPIIEAQSIESALSLVRCGLGATIVPSYIPKFGDRERNSSIRFIDPAEVGISLSESINTRKVCLFFRKSQFLTKAEKRFIESAKELKEKYS